MGFFIYDIIFLILFSLCVVIFLYKRRKNLKREGIIFLYKTKIGVKIIDYTAKKFSKPLHFLKYIVVTTGFILMSSVLFLIGHALYTYIKFPEIFKAIPPLAPVIPYFPKLFGMQKFFPDFYFTYFIIAIMIVAIVHEFSHGIFMRLFNIKIKSTGFAFLGPILGAFVEQDEKQMKKKRNLEQMSVLAAGTFANIIFALIFFGLLIGFFYSFFLPSGYIFNMYAMSSIPVNNITGFGNFSSNLTEVYAGDKTYFLSNELKSQLNQNVTYLTVYDDAPAVKSGLEGVIIQIDDMKISDYKELKKFLLTKKPGEIIQIKTKIEDEEKIYNIALGEQPDNNSVAYIGIGFYKTEPSGFISRIIIKFIEFKEKSTFYKPRLNGDFAVFVYYLLWWVALINLFVALFNMLPLWILDGSRFFYLTMLSITKSEKIAQKSFKIISYLILISLALMIFVWLLRIL